MAELFLGFDLSTQQLKVTAVNSALEIVLEERVSFDEELPEFGTKNGVHKHTTQPGRVTSPTQMWLKATDLLFTKLQAAKFPFDQVSAIGGCAQQHATVYWRRGASETLLQLDAKLSFAENLRESFTVPDSPIWMDSSTTNVCNEIETRFSGQVHLTTGSRCYERFSAMQIGKIFRDSPELYEQTERIELASNFFASILVGCYAPFDASDASGMNLLEIEPTREGDSIAYRWNAELCSLTAADLERRLSKVVRTGVTIGNVSKYLVDRFGFSQRCAVTTFTGDNPASCVGIGMQPGDVCVSLGTSDTCFALADHAAPKRAAHVFYSPLSTDSCVNYLILACFKNGSLQREEVRDLHAKGSWHEFEAALRRTAVGNNDCVGFYFTAPEILPDGVTGTYRFNRTEGEWKRCEEAFADDTEVRAVCEGQVLAKRLYCQRLGLHFGGDLASTGDHDDHVRRVLVTGGASRSDELIRLVANVFGTKVYRLRNEIVNSASLGGALLAYRATHESTGRQMPPTKLHEYVCVAQPDLQAFQTYTAMLADYETLESTVINLSASKR